MLVVSAHDNIGVTVDGEVVVGRQLRHRAGGAQASRPHAATWPARTSRAQRSALSALYSTLASELSGRRGMAAGAAFAHPRAAYARVRPIFFNHV